MDFASQNNIFIYGLYKISDRRIKIKKSNISCDLERNS